ncbi:TIGR03016 family PEP-CTERM system-associated outer membrane protein [Thalassotalea euphylliae]|nr:TIGR03016 family PEP-CTERM system-associated outer membrane protein [Thalassotalea euphylliae]
MAITDMAMDVKGKVSIAMLCQLLHFSVQAADSSFAPTISIEEVFSDNVELSSFDKQNSLVTRAILGLNHSISSAIINANINGNYTHQFYSHDSDANEGYESLSSQINITPWRKGPTVNLQANIANVPRSTGGNFASDLISGDTVRTTNYGAGLNYQVQNSDFLLSIGGQYNDSRSGDNVGESYGYTNSFSFQNGIGQKNVFWDISSSYSDRKNRGESARSYQVQARFGVITSWKLNPFIRYFDENFSGSVSNNSLNQGESYGAGFRWQPVNLMIIDLSYNAAEDEELSDDYVAFEFNWQPTTRTQISASYNQRFFGDSYGLNINHRNKRLTNTISYNEQIQAFQRDNFEVFTESVLFCPLNQPIDIDSCLSNLDNETQPELFFELPIFDIRPVEDNQFSLNKRLAWNSTLSLSRTTFSLTISSNEREDLNTGNTQDDVSFGLSTSRQLNARSQLTAAYQFSRNDFFTRNVDIDTERRDYYRTYTIGYSRTLGKSISVNFDLRHLARTSNTNTRDYDENRATLSITKDF